MGLMPQCARVGSRKCVFSSREHWSHALRRLRLEQLEDRRLLSFANTDDSVFGSDVGPALAPDLAAIDSSLLQQDTLGADHGRAKPIAKPGEWLVRFTGVSGAPEEQVQTFQQMVGGQGALHVERQLGQDGLMLLQTPEELGYEQLVDSLAELPGYEYAEPNYLIQVDSVPNDTQFTALWGMENTGQSVGGTLGTVDADIDAPEAWDISTGSSEVIVAVIDTGVDYTHPDLAANMWTNPSEIPGNGIDDDANGFVDDIHGWDFAYDDSDPMDGYGHGTHVAGTIGALGNNDTGVVGVNWNVQIMALKFLNDSGSGYTSDAVDALNYATRMCRDFGVNIKLTSNSWGGGGYSQALNDAIQASGDAGMLFIAAAGNAGSNNDASRYYPASYSLENIVAVAATDPGDGLAKSAQFGSTFNSNYGATTVDLGAPGVGILSTTPNNTYSTYNGTSMATPHVAGVAALAWSVAPSASPSLIKSAILGSVDPVPALAGKTLAGGRLNAANTLDWLALYVVGSSPAQDEFVAAPPTSFVIDLSAAYDPASVDAGDLTVNGIPADSFEMTDDDTVTFHYANSPVTTQGLQTMAMSRGALTLPDGRPVAPWNVSFRYDAIRVAVSSTEPAVGSIVPLPLTALRLNFNEPYDPATVGWNDLHVSQGEISWFNLIDADTVEYTFWGIRNEGTWMVEMAAGAVTDVYGNPMEAFSASYTLDFDTYPYSALLGPIAPSGSLVYGDSYGYQTQTGLIDRSGDTDAFSLEVDPGQTITVTVQSDATLRPTVQVFPAHGGGNVLLGSASAPAVGADAVVQTVATGGRLASTNPSSRSMEYLVVVGGATDTTGTYTVDITLNAAVEEESHGGPANDSLATAQDLAGSFIPLHGVADDTQSGPQPDRGAVRGRTDSPQVDFDPDALGSPDYYAFQLEAGQWATVAATATVGEVQLEIQDASGTTLAAGSQDPTNVGAVIGNFVAAESGTYFARVVADANMERDYTLLVTRDAQFDLEENSTQATAQPLVSPQLAGRRWALGYIGWDWEFSASDFYQVTVGEGKPLEVETFVPGARSGEFDNAWIDPSVAVYDPAGNRVAWDDNSAGDKRNARLTYNVPKGAGGVYTIEVSSSYGEGAYLLAVKGATGQLPPFAVVSVDPAEGTRVRGPVNEVTVDFNDVALLTTLEAADVQFDGVAASAIRVVDGDTVAFTVPAPLSEGIHTVTLAADAPQDVQGTPVTAFSSQFYNDILAPRIVSSSIQDGNIMVTDGMSSLAFTVQFDQQMIAANLDLSDFLLHGLVSDVAYTPASFDYDPEACTLEIQYASLPDDRYQLTLRSGDGRLEDIVGWDLDGEAPLTWPIDSANPTGDGTEGGDFVVNFVLDVATTGFPTPLDPVSPLGSLIYDGSYLPGTIQSAGDADNFTLDVDPGQTITVVVDPAIELQPVIELFGPDGTSLSLAMAGGVGLDAVLQTIAATEAGTYTVSVSGADDTMGTYEIQLVLNAAVESESHDGPTNNDIASAQDLNDSFVPLLKGADRGAVLGRTVGTRAAEVEPNDTLATAQNADFHSFSLDAGETTTLALKAIGQGNVDLELWDSCGLLATGTAAGTNLDEVAASYVAVTAGRYYARVSGSEGAADYSLIVTRDAVFDTELNNDLASAQTLAGLDVALGHVGGEVWSQIDVGVLHTGYRSQYVVDQLNDSTDFAFNAVAVPNSAVDSVAELMAFDVIVLGADPFANISTAAASAIRAWNEAGNGGVLGTAWLYYNLNYSSSAARPDLDAIVPLDMGLPGNRTWSYVVNVSANHPVTAGLPNFSFPSGETSRAGADTGFTVLGTDTNGLPTVIVSEVGGGRGVWLSPAYSDYSEVRQPGSPGDRLLEQAVAWGGSHAPDIDVYSFDAVVGEAIHLFTATPGDGPGQFANNLDPRIELYDPSGVLVASGTPLVDGRNEEINYAAPDSGVYRVRVVAENGTKGEYILDPVSSAVAGAGAAMLDTSLPRLNNDPSRDLTQLRTILGAGPAGLLTLPHAAPFDAALATPSWLASSAPFMQQSLEQWVAPIGWTLDNAQTAGSRRLETTLWSNAVDQAMVGFGDERRPAEELNASVLETLVSDLNSHLLVYKELGECVDDDIFWEGMAI